MSDAFTAGAGSTGDKEKDEERLLVMTEGVEALLQMQEEGNMTPPLETDRGTLSWYCRGCKVLGPVTVDVEEAYGTLKCSQCEGPVAVGTEMSLSQHFRLPMTPHP